MTKKKTYEEAFDDPTFDFDSISEAQGFEDLRAAGFTPERLGDPKDAAAYAAYLKKYPEPQKLGFDS